jgi:hypothetical protein
MDCQSKLEEGFQDFSDRFPECQRVDVMGPMGECTYSIRRDDEFNIHFAPCSRLDCARCMPEADNECMEAEKRKNETNDDI